MGGERLARADALEARFIPRFLDRTAEEWFALGLELRLPFAIVPDMQQVLSWPVFRDRKAIVPITIGDRTVEAPGSPFHLTRTPANFGGRVPEVGEHNPHVILRRAKATRSGRSRRNAARNLSPGGARSDERPLEGLRIIDLSMGWAGPICTRNLADLGADVIKIEACGYPDWWRGVDNRIETVTQRLYEKSHRFNIMNRGKRAITLDLTVPDGVALAKALVKGADAVIENYSAEVLRKFGLDYPELAKVNPSLVMVSMAAFGSTGPWRETRAYGSTLEQGSGLPSVAGRPDDPPMMNHLAYRRRRRRPQCLLGHADRAAASQADRRRASSSISPRSSACCRSRRPGRSSSRPPAASRRAPAIAIRSTCRMASFRRRAPTNGCSIAATDDAMWTALAQVIGWTTALARSGVAHRTSIERAVAAWTRQRSPDEAMEILQRAGVVAGAVRHPVRADRRSASRRRAASGNGSSAPMSAAIRSPRRPIASLTHPSR